MPSIRMKCVPEIDMSPSPEGGVEWSSGGEASRQSSATVRVFKSRVRVYDCASHGVSECASPGVSECAPSSVNRRRLGSDDSIAGGLAQAERERQLASCERDGLME